MWDFADWFLFVISAGAVMRITRLLTTDAILEKPRLWLINRIPCSWWLKLWTCQPCMSIWVASGVVAAVYFFHDSLWYVLPALALTLSQTVVLVAVSIDND